MTDAMTLGEAIDFLNGLAPGSVLRVRLSNPHSYRGYYECLAFECEEEPCDVSEALAMLKSQVGTIHTGWKGGEYGMGRNSHIYLAEEGRTGDPISPLLLKMLVVS